MELKKCLTRGRLPYLACSPFLLVFFLIAYNSDSIKVIQLNFRTNIITSFGNLTDLNDLLENAKKCDGEICQYQSGNIGVFFVFL